MISAGELMGKAGDLLAKGIRGFIGPPGLLCCRCGTMAQYGGLNPLKLCRDCFDSIPWIKDIHCPFCGRYETCPDCVRREHRPLSMSRSAVRYDDRMKDLLARYKYRGDERLQELFGRMLVHAYRKYPPGAVFDCITYVPLSAERYAERGFNQAEQMAKVLSRQVKLPVVPLLTRVRHTNKQSFKSRQERLEDLSGVFCPDRQQAAGLLRLAGRRKVRILVVDDVYTTGSTLHQCAFVMKQMLPESRVYGLCWAR